MIDGHNGSACTKLTSKVAISSKMASSRVGTKTHQSHQADLAVNLSG